MATRSYQWRRCDASGAACADIAGATATTYSPVTADVGSTIRCVETYDDGLGHTVVGTSAPSPVIAAAGSGGGGGGTLDGGPIAAPAGTSMHWGAYIEGTNTYNHYFPGQRPGGGSWQNCPWDLETWDKFEADAGKDVSIVHWGMSPAFGHDFTYWAGTLNAVRNRNAINLVDMSSGSESLSDIANGSRDAYFQTWGAQAAAWGHPLFLRWNWEMNGSWFSWGAQAHADAAAYVASWRRMHDIIVGQGATNVAWMWCPNLAFSGSTSMASLYPGDAYVDWTALDGYNQGGASVAFTTLYQDSYDQVVALAPDKPMAIAEIGSFEYSGGKAAWITDMHSVLVGGHFPNIKALVWFNYWIYEDGIHKEWPIESSAGAQAAFAAGIGNAAYLHR